MGNQYAKNLTTDVVAITSTPAVVLAIDKGRAIIVVKNVGANQINISTNYQTSNSPAPDTPVPPDNIATNFWPLAAGEILSFDKGVAPLVLSAVSPSGSSLSIIAG